GKANQELGNRKSRWGDASAAFLFRSVRNHQPMFLPLRQRTTTAKDASMANDAATGAEKIRQKRVDIGLANRQHCPLAPEKHKHKTDRSNTRKNRHKNTC